MLSPTPSQKQALGGARLPHFDLAAKRGQEAPALVDYILVAEFDIDSGRCACARLHITWKISALEMCTINHG